MSLGSTTAAKWGAQEVAGSRLLLQGVLLVPNGILKPVLCFLSETEAKKACAWLRAAGFPQYAQLYEGESCLLLLTSVPVLFLGAPVLCLNLGWLQRELAKLWWGEKAKRVVYWLCDHVLKVEALSLGCGLESWPCWQLFCIPELFPFGQGHEESPGWLLQLGLWRAGGSSVVGCLRWVRGQRQPG